MDPFVQSVLLVLLGAVITLGGTLLTDLLRGRRDAERERDRREAETIEKRREASLDDTRRVHIALVDLGQIGTTAHTTQTPIDEDDIETGVRTVRQGYLLIPDLDVRQSLADALTLISNIRTRNVTDDDWTQACLRASFVVAAFLRGEPQPPAEHASHLSGLRLKYTGA